MADVCILPPNDGADSEVEGIDDEDLSPNEPADICGEIDLFIGHSDSEAEAAAPQQEADKGGAVLKSRKRKAPKSDKPKVKKGKTAAEKVQWKKNDKFSGKMPEGNPVPLANSHPELIGRTPLGLFEQIYGNDSFEYFKAQFELYAHRDKNTPSFSTSVDEIRKYFGIILLSGYHCLPSERD